MNLKILKETKAPLLNRKELLLEAEFEKATPKGSEFKEAIAKLVKADPSVVEINKVSQTYGLRKAQIIAYIYDKKENLEALQVITAKTRRQSKKQWLESKKKSKEAKPAETPKVEEKKEVPKEEVKKEPVKEEKQDGKKETSKEQSPK